MVGPVFALAAFVGEAMNDEETARVKAAQAVPDIDKGRWILVPAEPTPEMIRAGGYLYPVGASSDVYRKMLSVVPEAPNDSITAEEARTFQNWAGMDGATAWHLIDRHANGWGDVGRMMDAWLAANLVKDSKA